MRDGETPDQGDSPKVNPRDYFSRTEWYGNETTPGMRDEIWDVDQDRLDRALTAARAEGNLSRANVARHLGWTPPDTRRTRRNTSSRERGYAAAARLLAGVNPEERKEWITGMLAAIEDDES